ncbi:hypothetical protein M3Y98_01070200 [Aphelenchoides besseyi]|nr:hypothetical protein M3Y98_01070200 [Aphelenchoides besseyi]KAI6209625.1 hypothetical protein M3Y96_00240600 [Aphelenchoides besseyi]
MANMFDGNYMKLSWSLLLWITVVSAGKSRVHLPDHDPNAQYVCQGELSEFAACLCNDEEQEVSCVNAQFVDVHAFHYLNTYYSSIRKLTFHGNNFQDLPDKPIFGSYIHDDLQLLNISANYIVNLHNNALIGAPNIRILDLSNNEIVLHKNNVEFLKPTRKLQQLYLRRAFTSSVNRTVQFDLMMQMFYAADLKQLKYLDLSYNFLTSIPYDLGCPFPSLSFLDLRQNMLSTLSANVSCLSGLDNLDLSRNYFHELDEDFRRNFANYLPPQSLTIRRNLFYCDCHSSDFIAWFRSTNTIREKNMFTCSKASPANYVGSRLVEVPVHLLDCTTPMETSTAASRIPLLSLLIAAVLL